MLGGVVCVCVASLAVVHTGADRVGPRSRPPLYDDVPPSTVETTDPLVVQTTRGAVRGSLDAKKGVETFHGIPFAAPPLQDLRWTAPQEHEAWTGVRDATHPGPECTYQWSCTAALFCVTRCVCVCVCV